MATQLSSDIPPPKPRIKIAAHIKCLEIGQSILIEDAGADSVHSVLTRLRKEYKKRRRFMCAKAKGGMRVWRMP